ncbi:uncharacterized protein BDZ99DRAFT_112973 [Mytilinidion resinicola]|uniref:Uncharacterized protein n=1 Tax=Mytilinidion resinicola TaxID=574789 RepID=A0A6A6Y8T4_9PEZI|nr:uncharacterized protein BDZ99DRAFT_112973 [Mytilinidion resinicola]KAF2805100.1 hypothetical protein BDZ99DRAFT_112973 [Mytilinidion resinicola]
MMFAPNHEFEPLSFVLGIIAGCLFLALVRTCYHFASRVNMQRETIALEVVRDVQQYAGGSLGGGTPDEREDPELWPTQPLRFVGTLGTEALGNDDTKNDAGSFDSGV